MLQKIDKTKCRILNKADLIGAIKLEEYIETTKCNNQSETFEAEWCKQRDNHQCTPPTSAIGIPVSGISPMFLAIIFVGLLAFIVFISYVW